MPSPSSPGTAAPRYTRADRARQVEEALARGLTVRQVAAELGLSVGHVHNLRHDPTGAKDKARKESYRKPCPKCGTLMSGQDGPTNAPKQCRKCSDVEGRNRRRWTREAVIAAIQLFAERNGRPPTASEWLLPKRLRGADYPPASAIYRHQGKTRAGKHNPFATWADAIEAAGFPRPTVGHKVNPRGQGAHTYMVDWVVLRKEKDGHWSEQRVRAPNPELAVDRAALTPGEYVAIRDTSWTVRRRHFAGRFAVMPTTPGPRRVIH